MEYTDIELKNEKWKDIFGYDGMYQVSDLGRVRSKKYGRWKVMRPGTNSDGYLVVGLSKENKRKTVKVHRLVASAFIENDNIFNTEINHINEIKSDNRVSNLEYCDRQYNNTYNDIHLRHKQYTHPKYKLNKVKELYDTTLTYKQNIELFRAHGVECSTRVIQDLRRDLGLLNQRQRPKERF